LTPPMSINDYTFASYVVLVMPSRLVIGLSGSLSLFGSAIAISLSF